MRCQSAEFSEMCVFLHRYPKALRRIGVELGEGVIFFGPGLGWHVDVSEADFEGQVEVFSDWLRGASERHVLDLGVGTAKQVRTPNGRAVDAVVAVRLQNIEDRLSGEKK